MKNLILLGLFLFLFSSCEKEKIKDCFKGSGKITTEERSIIEPYSKIILNDDINLFLTQDLTNKVIIKGGENLLPKIIVKIKNDTLIIRNDNKCNWIRGYDNVINCYLYINQPGFYYLLHLGIGNVTSTDTLDMNYLYFDSSQSFGTVDLTLNCNKSYIVSSSGATDFIIKGKSINSLIFSRGYGIMDCRDLTSEYTKITYDGTNKCFVYVTKELTAELNYIGDVYYLGNPETVISTINGSGKLIKLGN